MTISVGSGGSATLIRGTPDAGGDGSTSSLSGGLSDSVLGGSGGANARPYNATQGQASTLGWSGGGGSVHASNWSTGSTGQGGTGSKGGNAWFDGASSLPQAGGGGGGAGGAGTNAIANVAGDGGAGVESSVSGSSTYYGGGGGGGKRTLTGTQSSGGNGGGGAGGWASSGEAGDPNTGGGGGGGSIPDPEADGGDGGSGVVIIRYSLNPDPPTSTSVTSGDGQMTVAYTLPTHTGGGTLSLEYQLTPSGGSAGSWTSLGETDGSTVISSAVANGTLYSVKLRAKNTVGSSSYTSSEVAVGDVLPLRVGEILRLDGTNPSSYSGSGTTWTDLQLGVTASKTASISFDATTKSFSGFATSQQFTVGNIATSFSDGISVFAVVDFADDDRYWERIVDFGTGEAQNNIIFSRYGTEENLVLRTYAVSGGSYWQCRTTTGTAIQDGFHQYGVSLADDGTCTFYRDGSIIAGPSSNISKTAGSPILPTTTLTSNYIGQTNWSSYKDGGTDDEYFSGSIQSVVVYNT
ncbi:MAG: fibronectin type III domain-containing protein, partial [Pontimonas sp.]